MPLAANNEPVTLFDSYTSLGWHLVPIPPGQKCPTVKGWNEAENCITDSGRIPEGWNIGLAHAYSGTAAIDIDVLADATAYLASHGIDLNALLNAPDAVRIESGREGRTKLLYALPFGLPIASKKMIATAPDGTKYNFIDFRCATAGGLTVQDVLPPSTHPDTNRSYEWGGHGSFDNLPTMPQALVELWHSLISHTDDELPPSDPKLIELETIRSALEFIDPGISREEWIHVGMALHHAGEVIGNNDAAMMLFNTWSAKSKDKYKGERDIRTVWRSFKSMANRGIRIDTLFYYARENGWVATDASKLFTTVKSMVCPTTFLGKFQTAPTHPVCDLSLFPEIIAARALEVATMVGSDPVVPLLAALSSVCAAVDSRTKLRVTESWTVPPILWLMTIGLSSDKKSPGSKPLHSILYDIQEEDFPRYRAEALIWKGHEAKHVSQMKAFQQFYSSAEMELSNSPPPFVSELPPEPKQLRLIINDATSQKVIHLADGRPRGFLLLLDEMENWLKRINSPQSGEDRGCWIQGYETGSYTMDRVTTGTISAENLAVVIYGNIQPDVFKRHIEQGSADGLMQRFLPVTIDREKTTLWQDDTPSFMTRKGEYEKLIRSIFNLPQVEYSLSPAAREIFRTFCKWYLELRRAEIITKSSKHYMTALGKSEGTCLRLALVFHIIQAPSIMAMPGETMQQAVDCMMKFFIPSMKYAFNDVASTESTLARWTIDHIVQNSGIRDTIRIADIKRSSRRQTENMDNKDIDMTLQYIMADLCDAGYVAQLPLDGKTANYAINPRLASEFAEYRAAVIKSKAQIKEIFDAIPKKNPSAKKRGP